MKTRLPALAIGAVACVAFSGCLDAFSRVLSANSAGKQGGDPPSKVNISTPYSGTETLQPGTVFTPSGSNVAVSNRVIRGTFSVTLPTRVEVPKQEAKKSAKGIKSVTGTYLARTQGTYFPSSDTAQLTGVQVMKFSIGKLGTACLDLTTTTSNSGNNSTGTFNLTGGTKTAKTSRFTGTYTNAGQSSGPGTFTQTYAGTITGKLKFNKNGRPLSDDCKALAAQLG